MSYVRMFVAVFVIVMIGSLCAYWWCASCRDALLTEDDVTENLTAFLYLLAFGLSVVHLAKSRRSKGLATVTGALGLLVFLEEISFGERVFGFSRPYHYGVKVDSLHDLVDIATRIVPAHKLFFAIAAGVAAVSLIVFSIKCRAAILRILTRIIRQEATILLACFFLLGFLALWIDLLTFAPLIVVEEAFELSAAIALVMAVLSLRTTQPA